MKTFKEHLTEAENFLRFEKDIVNAINKKVKITSTKSRKSGESTYKFKGKTKTIYIMMEILKNTSNKPTIQVIKFATEPQFQSGDIFFKMDSFGATRLNNVMDQVIAQANK